MNVGEEIADLARKHLDSILDMSGKVLYSGVETLVESPVYLLGHNPGGSPIKQATETIRADLTALPNQGTNAYLDESWLGRPPGEGRLQSRVIWLLEALGFNPRKVPASNLIFVRSQNASTTPFQEYAKVCWPVHERIIELVNPGLLLVFGNSDPSPYTFLAKKFGGVGHSSCPSGHGDWSCRSFTVPGKFRVAGLPHLSRYKVIGHHLVVEWLGALLNQR